MNRQVSVLVVEDDLQWVRFYRRAFDRHGWLSQYAESRDGAIERLRAKTFDVAVVDLQLRNDITHKGGIDVINYLAKCNEGVTAFAISASEDIRDASRSYEQGVFRFLHKDDYATIGDVVDKVVSGYDRQTLKPNFGGFDTLTAYLAAPEISIYWEDQITRCLGAKFEYVKVALERIVGSFAPILRRKDQSVSFQQDTDRHAIGGSFWSKSLGTAIWLTLFGPKGEPIPPPEPTEPVGRKTVQTGVGYQAWELEHIGRDAFLEFTWEPPR